MDTISRKRQPQSSPLPQQGSTMRAICLDADQHLHVRNIAAPGTPPPGHVVVDIAACAINHGDKVFLADPKAAGGVLSGSNVVWGASASGTIRTVGAQIPHELIGKQVAIYRSLARSDYTLGLWSEQAQVPAASCVVLPDTVAARDYCGSLVNVITPLAFLDDCVAGTHHGVIATAGASATALALAVLAQSRGVPVLHLVRSDDEQTQLREWGIEHVLVTTHEDFLTRFEMLAGQLDATAVFDGVGGGLLGQLAPHVPMNTTFYVYGLLDATTPLMLPTRWLMSKNLVIRRFSNFNSPTAKQPERLAAVLAGLRDIIADTLLRTRIGQTFSLDAIDAALAWRGKPGMRAVLVP